MVDDRSTAEQDFTQKVIEGSQQTPVICFFHSPARRLLGDVGQALEQAVRQQGGAVKLVKVDVDQNRQLAQQLRLQSLPTVYAFVQGQPYDGFAGAQANAQQVQQFVQQVAQQGGGGQDQQAQIDHALQQAKGALDAGEVATAQQIYGQVLQIDEQNAGALAG